MYATCDINQNWHRYWRFLYANYKERFFNSVRRRRDWGWFFKSFNIFGTLVGRWKNLKLIHNFRGLIFAAGLLLTIRMWWLLWSRAEGRSRSRRVWPVRFPRGWFGWFFISATATPSGWPIRCLIRSRRRQNTKHMRCGLIKTDISCSTFRLFFIGDRHIIHFLPSYWQPLLIYAIDSLCQKRHIREGSWMLRYIWALFGELEVFWNCAM